MSEDFPSLVILLIRHGHSRREDEPYGPDTPLNPLGHRQAEATAEAISRTHSIAAIYSSPFPRALQTAEPLCLRLDQGAQVDDRLSECQVQPQAPDEEHQDLELWQPYHRGVRGGESLEEFSLRVADVIEELCERHLGETIAVFSHSGTIDATARWAVGLPTNTIWQHDLPIMTGSITELTIWPHGRIESGSPRYVEFTRVGDQSHLDPSLREE